MNRTLAVVVLVLATGAPARAVELPVGTPLSIRLITRVSSKESRPGDPVEAVLIAPVEVVGRPALIAGGLVRGTVGEVGKRKGRASLRLDFSELVDEDGQTWPISTRVVAIEDSRESVADDGRIVGIKPRHRLPSAFMAFLMVAARAHPIFLALFEAARQTVRIVEKESIDYRPGVELTLGLAAPLQIAAWPPTVPEAAPEPAHSAIVQSLPFRTQSAKGNRDTDVTNILIVGSRQQVESAFAEAGWTRPRSMSTGARLRGLLALVVRSGYAHSAVSGHELSGRPPDLVFQKQHNTLAKRHHVRFWQCDKTAAGQGVWVGAGTHDVGIVFKDRNFTHRIDPEIDGEREKIVNDLQFTGQVASVSLLERPDAPRLDGDASGDSIETDGRVAVIVLRSEAVASPSPVPAMVVVSSTPEPIVVVSPTPEPVVVVTPTPAVAAALNPRRE